ncbi:alpha-1,2-fucosyltransferase [Desulfovibrio desulfuricans]|uniref:alpha-1,2-fucosyltransferase n=1 Tax=Desulfovibrio desulfuricans TaxID=876 RepID=UPI001F3695BE|nr:alpha-1,2-fucosyltransferase [Desulfovibrio desulfuricans]UIB00015.1 alpha-1,2-fucosyltransferase [Desulfovibrio desulfuricans]
MSVVVHVCGGLGNQMFQYAMGRALSVRYGVPLLLDLSWFQNMQGCTPRSFQLEIFPALQREKSLWSECSSVDRKKLCHVPLWKKFVGKFWGRQCVNANHIFEGNYVPEKFFEKMHFPVYLQGYWQNARYFEDISSVIAEDFTFGKLPVTSTTLADEIVATENSVFIHVRRGDYVHNAVTNAHHGVCSDEYYKKAIQYIQNCTPQATLFLFSDDPEWVRYNFDTHGLPSVIVDLHDEATAYCDMYLMSLCRHHIIANSSFSWWGAWLAKGGGITISPKRWVLDPQRNEENPSMESWHKI